MTNTTISKNNILSRPIETEMQTAYADYAMSVIVGRALPDARDGLKPVHRRILYAMHEAKNFWNNAFKKSARIVGDVMGKYHPHGDAAIYNSLARMAQDFSLLMPLVDGQGNFGSIDGDEPAQMRYTEARLTKLADLGLLIDLDKETVDFQSNYDSSEQEPKVLPVRFPNLLVNGSNGIAVGMATNIPPHNMGEVLDACCAYLDNEELTLDQLLEYVPGPDFPTGGLLLGADRIKTALATGRGSIIVRGKSHIEGQNKKVIVITEIPYQVNKSELVKTIEVLSNEKTIEGISEIRDESNKLGIRIVLELKKEAEAEVILNKLYKHSQLQTSFGVNMVALKDGQPLIMNLYEMIVNFLKFREEVVRNRTKYLLKRAQDKAHNLVGLLIAVENIEEIIPLIRISKDPQLARDSILSRSWKADKFIKIFASLQDDRNFLENDHTNLSELQVKSIMDMRLQRLTALEEGKLQSEVASLVDDIQEYRSLLESRPKLLNLMKEEFLELKSTFAKPRKTNISQEILELSDMDLIQCEDIAVTITRDGYIKKTALTNYKGQKRSGRGKATMNVSDEDSVAQLIITTTHHNLLFFTDLGRVYKLIAYQIPTGSLQSKGRAIVNLIPLGDKEKVTTVIAIPYVKHERNKKVEEPNEEELIQDEDLVLVEESEEEINLPADNKDYIVFATSNGNVRRNSLQDFYNIPSNGKIAIGLEEGDKLVGVQICKAQNHLFLATQLGKAIRFPLNKIRVFKGRSSSGVRGIRLQDDKVVSLAILKGITIANDEKDAYLKINLDKRQSLAETSYEEAKILATKLVNKIELASFTPERLIELAKDEEFLLTVMNRGYGKCSSSYSYRITGRGGQGVINANLKKYTGEVMVAFPLTLNDDLVVVTKNAITIRIAAEEIRVSGRSSSGVRLINLHEDDLITSVSSVSKILDDKEEEFSETDD